MRKFLLFLLLLCRPLSALDIQAPTEVEFGNLVEIVLEPAIAETVVIKPALVETVSGVIESWTPQNLPHKQYDVQQKKIVVFAMSNRVRSAILVLLIGETKESGTEYSTKHIQVRSTKIPTPPPDPDKPIPPPDPTPIPDDEFGNLGKALNTLVKTFPTESRQKARATAELYREANTRFMKLPSDGGFINSSQSQAYIQQKRIEIWGAGNVDLQKILALMNPQWEKGIVTRASTMRFYDAVIAGLSN